MIIRYNLDFVFTVKHAIHFFKQNIFLLINQLFHFNKLLISNKVEYLLEFIPRDRQAIHFVKHSLAFQAELQSIERSNHWDQ
jgi:hypothetical protein